MRRSSAPSQQDGNIQQQECTKDHTSKGLAVRQEQQIATSIQSAMHKNRESRVSSTCSEPPNSQLPFLGCDGADIRLAAEIDDLRHLRR